MLVFSSPKAPIKLASLTGFAPVISCKRGRHVGWTTPQGLPKAPNPGSLMFYYQQLWIDLLKIWSLGFVWSLEFGCWSFRHGVPSRTLTSNLSLGHSRSVLLVRVTHPLRLTEHCPRNSARDTEFTCSFQNPPVTSLD